MTSDVMRIVDQRTSTFTEILAVQRELLKEIKGKLGALEMGLNIIMRNQQPGGEASLAAKVNENLLAENQRQLESITAMTGTLKRHGLLK